MSQELIYLFDPTHQSNLGLGSDTMPLQLGLVAAHTLKTVGDRVTVELFKYPRDFEAAVLDRPPFILGVSHYLWNADVGYKFAAEVSRKHPEVIIVFGGPNYPEEHDRQLKWWADHPAVDFYIYKDGEVPFSSLVEFLLDNPDVLAAKKALLPSCHAVHDGRAYFGKLSPRLKDLSETPSPHTLGLLDKFYDGRLIPMMQTNRGCPFPCTYCVEGGPYYNRVSKNSLNNKKAEIDYIADHVTGTKTIKITDSNFGMFQEDVDFAAYLGHIRRTRGYPENVTASTGKNKKERVLEVNRLLGGILRLTASVQSMNKEVLTNVKRTNISLNALISLSDQTSDTQTHTYSEIILALPGDSPSATRESFRKLIDIGLGNVTQHQLALLYGAEVASRESRRRFGLKSMFRPVQRCIGFYTFDGRQFPSVEIEEVCVANNEMTFEDYLEGRRLYLTVGMFYNDRIFGEINALLRVLGLSTFGWLELIHDNTSRLPREIRDLYEGFVRETRDELWDSPEDLVSDIEREIDRYTSGEIGGNLIYKYRVKSIVGHFDTLQATAYEFLREYLAECGVDCPEAVAEIERLSRLQKADLFDSDRDTTATFQYDLLRLITDPSLARSGGSLEDLRQPTTLRIAHSPNQKEAIGREMEFFGRDLAGLTLLVARYPIKRLYRTIERLSDGPGELPDDR